MPFYKKYCSVIQYDFNNLSSEADLIAEGNRADYYPPLRTWWKSEPNHYTKVDQVHYASKKIMSLIKSVDLSDIIKDFMPNSEVLQLWSASLFNFSPESDEYYEGRIGLHSDMSFTDFINGDYLIAIFPIINTVDHSIIISSDTLSSNKILNPIDTNIDDALTFLAEEQNMAFQRIELSPGDILVCTSSCVRGMLNSSEKKSYVVAYLRSEENYLIEKKNHYGMCDRLSDLIVSPVLYFNR